VVPDPLPPVQIGDVLASKYLVERVLGQGGMGQVVAARHQQLGFLVALKLMLPRALRHEGAQERFLREARAAGGLRGEHVARVTDFGVLPDGTPYIVMEYLEGSDLMAVLAARGKLPPAEAVQYVLQACKAMDEAHRQGIVHRDIKPQNLFLTTRPDGSPLVKVLDFGISKLVSADAPPSMTLSAMVMGSPLYMSPEQLRSAKKVDARTDIYALGVILYQLMSGRLPIEAETFGELAERVFGGQVVPLRSRAPQVSAPLEAIVMRCLEKNADDRFPSIRELASALGAVSYEEGVVPIQTQPASMMSPFATTGMAPALSQAETATLAPAPAPALTPTPGTASVRAPNLRLVGAAGAIVLVGGVALAYLRPEASRPTDGPAVASASGAATSPPAPAASDPPVAPVAPPPPPPSPATPATASVSAAPARSLNVTDPRPAASKATKPAPALSTPAPSASIKRVGPGGYDPFPTDFKTD
jgi:serine/threonine protein kinase